ncbi:MAG: carbohydrate-binding domain-containing protein [Lachnospiraceae bacterium]|nr:carbohydrate-binding domain-containing protein [Lachnospiraceae bacterium]
MKNNRKKKIFTLVAILALALAGCGNRENSGISGSESGSREWEKENSQTGASQEGEQSSVDSNLFSDRDFETDYDEDKSAYIQLQGDTATCDSDAVEISGSRVTIKDEGTYVLTGSLENGMVIVDSGKTDKTQLVLNGVSIHSETCAPIYVRQADKVFITLAPESRNTLSNGGEFATIDDNHIDAVIFSKEDITLNGSGSLTIHSPAGHGIVSKDELTLTGGTYSINTASHGISGKDNLCIANAVFDIISGKDGLQAENEDDASLGFIHVESGTFRIDAQGDGLSGASVRIEDGSFDITTGGGSENAEKKSSDSWGGFMGGGRAGMGGRKPGSMGGNSQSSSSAASEEDSTSIKGIKADGSLVINGGSYVIDSADDAMHSNTDVTVSGGSFEISSGDDAFHANDTLCITAGTIRVSESYEGLEGLHVEISGGDIYLVASDDGVNAAGGTDASGFGGFRGNDRFGGGGSSNGSVVISDGMVYIKASGDGIDANGTLTISGGEVTVCGPTQGDTAVLDYDTSATITGGTFVGTGSVMMAQTFSDAKQGVIAVQVGNQEAATKITLEDEKGNVILSREPELSYAIIILSNPNIKSGETYTLNVGNLSGELEAY